MIKYFFLLFAVLAVSVPAVVAPQSLKPTQPEVARNNKETAKTPLKLPAEIKVILIVEEMPGMGSPRSIWEGVYEVRVADWRTIVEKTKSGGDAEDSGVVLLQSSFASRSLSQKENRRVTISLPVAGPLLERLQQQAQNPQAFLLRSTVRVFDAKLDRNYALKVNRIWQFKLFPDGEATITVGIKEDGGSSVWGPIPKQMPPGYTIIGVPPTKKP